MTASFAELERSLQQVLAAAALARAAAGVRELVGDLTEAAPAPLPDDARLPDLDLGALLDPLAESALAAMRAAAAPAAGAAPFALRMPVPRREARAAGGSRRPSIASHFADATAPAAPSSRPSVALRAAAQPAAQVVALLARHARAVIGLGESESARPLATQGAATRTVVPFPRHRAADAPRQTGGLVQAGVAGAKGLADLLARFTEAASGVDIRRLIAGEAADRPARRRPRRSDPDVPAAASAPAGATPSVDEVVRLVDLAIATVADALPAPVAPAESAPAREAAPRDPAPEAAATRRIAAALARIEERLAERAPQPAAPQWLDDDDDLADRVQRILRRQVSRHGIGPA